MKMYKFICFVLTISFVHTVFGELQLREGATCTSSEGSPGVCKKESECSSLQDDIRNGRLSQPEVCSYELKNSTVCCPNSNENTIYSRVCEKDSGDLSAQGYGLSRSKRYENIFGGSRVVSRELSHLAAIGFYKRNLVYWLCGGTLIHKRFVLTAGHCMEDQSFYHYGKPRVVRLGDLDLKSSQDDAVVQMYNVARRIPHPDYRVDKKYYDIALLQLDKDVKFDDFVKPACLHLQYDISSKNPVAAGWGTTEQGNKAVGKKLMKVDLDFHPLTKCNESIYNAVNVTEVAKVLNVGLQEDSMLCAGVLKGGKDSCKGDSGGPLQVRVMSTKCEYDVVGIVSFGLGCAKPDTPAVYTRVSKYVPWIESVVCSWKN